MRVGGTSIVGTRSRSCEREGYAGFLGNVLEPLRALLREQPQGCIVMLGAKCRKVSDNSAKHPGLARYNRRSHSPLSGGCKRNIAQTQRVVIGFSTHDATPSECCKRLVRDSDSFLISRIRLLPRVQ